MKATAAGLDGVVLIKSDGLAPWVLSIQEAEQLTNDLIDAMEDARGNVREPRIRR